MLVFADSERGIAVENAKRTEHVRYLTSPQRLTKLNIALGDARAQPQTEE